MLTDLISRFATPGPYLMRRQAQGSYVDGRYEPSNAFTETQIVASIQPMEGATLSDLPEGQVTEETRQLWTETRLWPREASHDPDLLVIEGETWEVLASKRWEAFGEVFYVVTITRLEVP